ncbi:putative cytochrome p450 [Xylaria bambusicola]|uniref:putative cytochrome p450 n=1 Tax=Xylaria bambusicola TaxID=326684 RepID=UPI002007942F|nr:putative cytochrome p450 [Xylaria bambusicola]KAI0506259.1 putative cytochrome p450 [Xylaria bambusicola]
MTTSQLYEVLPNWNRPLLNTQDPVMLLYIILLLLISWVLWRTWRFTIYPKLHPDEPKELPYVIPILGHGIAFFRDSNGLLAYARAQVGRESTPFALTAFGNTFYVVTNAKHSAELYRNMESLSFDEFVQALMRTNGSDEKTIQTVFSPLPKEKPGFPNPDGLSLGSLSAKMHTLQRHPGANMLVLQQKGCDWINAHLNLETLGKECAYSASRSSMHIQVPLYEWTSDYFVRLGQHVYFGDPLDRVDPGYPAAFIVFDEVIWKMLYQYPAILCRDMTAPRDQMIRALTAYFKIPKAERVDHAAWIINAMEDEMRGAGMDDRNIAIMIFHLYFAINTNARKTSFWMLTHMMRRPHYLAAFRAETAPAFHGDVLVDLNHIQDPEKCPQVDAMWNETLRLAGWAASVRRVTCDTVLGGKRLRKGNRVMVPHRLLHFDEKIFGDDTAVWKPERWIDTEAGRKLPNSQSWRPFGGGKTKCSGRFLAKYFVTAFVATMLRRFDIEAVGDPPMPEADVGRPVLGIISVKEGQDYHVRITRRKGFVNSG